MDQMNRTLHQLQQASEHLYYEFWMFSSLANGLSLNLIGDGPIGNAMLESFVIHLRSVIDFLYLERPKPDDVIAVDFFDESGQWEKIRPNLSPILDNVKHRVGKEIAHLTYQRLGLTAEQKQWHFVEISNELTKIFKLFYENVEKDKLSAKWKNMFF